MSTATLSIALPYDISADEARLLLSVKLYEVGKLSLGKAAELAGYSKRAFIEVAARHGAAIIDYPPEDLAGELRL